MGTYTKITTPPAYCSHSRDDLIGVPRPSRNRVFAVPQSVFLSGVGSKLGSLLSAVYADVRVRAFQFDMMRHRSFNNRSIESVGSLDARTVIDQSKSSSEEIKFMTISRKNPLRRETFGAADHLATASSVDDDGDGDEDEDGLPRPKSAMSSKAMSM